MRRGKNEIRRTIRKAKFASLYEIWNRNRS